MWDEMLSCLFIFVQPRAKILSPVHKGLFHITHTMCKLTRIKIKLHLMYICYFSFELLHERSKFLYE